MDERKEIGFKSTLFIKEHTLVLDPEFIEFYISPDDLWENTFINPLII